MREMVMTHMLKEESETREVQRKNMQHVPKESLARMIEMGIQLEEFQ